MASDVTDAGAQGMTVDERQWLKGEIDTVEYLKRSRRQARGVAERSYRRAMSDSLAPAETGATKSFNKRRAGLSVKSL